MIKNYFLPRVSGKRTVTLFSGFGLLVLLFLCAAIATQPTAAAQPTAADAVHRAWSLAQQLGAYRYTSDLEQITYPAASLANVGRGPLRDQLYVEGESDSAAQRMNIRLWQGGGSLFDLDHAVEIRVADGQTLARQGQGAWQPLDTVADLFSPTQNPLTFLSVIKNVNPVDTGPTIDHPLSTINTSPSTSTAPPLPSNCAYRWKSCCVNGGNCRRGCNWASTNNTAP